LHSGKIKTGAQAARLQARIRAQECYSKIPLDFLSKHLEIAIAILQASRLRSSRLIAEK
jgi:hypothetical protein